MLVNSISASSVEEISGDMKTIITYMYYRFASHLYTVHVQYAHTYYIKYTQLCLPCTYSTLHA